jgi:hypothetical protein
MNSFYTEEELKIALLPGMQEKFREMMGLIAYRDNFLCKTCGKKRVYAYEMDDACANLGHDIARLPLPIDPQDTSRLERGESPRGLLGMIDRVRALAYADDGTWGVYTTACIVPSVGKTPTLALLRALQHQWEVKG